VRRCPVFNWQNLGASRLLAFVRFLVRIPLPAYLSVVSYFFPVASEFATPCSCRFFCEISRLRFARGLERGIGRPVFEFSCASQPDDRVAGCNQASSAEPH